MITKVDLIFYEDDVVYPSFEIYPGEVIVPQERSPISVHLPAKYPAFEICQN